ncbi:hypothetical protein BURPSS13_0189 [Burkholderia pseudomallei S13]|nr:hypothetical protein BURPSS13_0189 [Burkholderia pseudomallei S13]
MRRADMSNDPVDCKRRSRLSHPPRPPCARKRRARAHARAALAHPARRLPPFRSAAV